MTVSSICNSRGLLERRTWVGGRIDPARLDFSYNDASQRSEIKRYSDTAGSSQIGRTTFGYDAQGRENDIVHRNALDAVIADYDYVFDLADQLASSTHHGQTTTYTHDDAGQLTAANHSVQSDEAYSYDLNGNRTTTGIVTGPNNQVLADGTYDYTYDGEGNLLTKTEIGTGLITAYSYDYRNRLVKVATYLTTETPLSQVDFTYDAFDRRIAKSVDSDGDGPQNATVERFVYDGEHVWADFNGGGSVTVRYLYADVVDVILARFRPSEGVAWYLPDHLGSVRDIAGLSGAIIDHIDYDSFGNVVSETSPSHGDRIKFTSREFDPASGLYYYRARYYDPVTGRFTSQDPIAFTAGDANLYRYVSNQPLIATDPTGLTSVAFTAGAIAYDLQLAEGVNGFTFGYACGFLDGYFSGDPNPNTSAMLGAAAGYAIGSTLSAVPLKQALMFSLAFAIGGVRSIAAAAGEGNELLAAVRTACFTAPLMRAGARALATPGVTRHVGQKLKSFFGEELGALKILLRNPRGRGPSGRLSALKYLDKHWDKATFGSKGKSIEYHVGKHGKELSAVEYTQRALAAFEDRTASRTMTIDKQGRPAVKIASGTGVGLFTPSGKVIWFQPS